MDISHYSYKLPEELIAHAPAEPRDSSRVLVYSTATDELALDVFANLARYIPSASVLVLNDTRVDPARIELTKLTGGSVRVLFLLNEWDGGSNILGLPDRKIVPGDTLFQDHKPVVRAVSNRNEEFAFKIVVPVDEFKRLIGQHGRTPLPPYIHSQMKEGETRAAYQTVFAHRPGDRPSSVAAPTASLHFTDTVLESLREKGVEEARVTLSVGRGTFAPVTGRDIERGSLHREPIRIEAGPARRIAAAKRERRQVVAAGTTAARLLEAAAEHILKGEGFDGSTDLMIAPPYSFKVMDALITNFHLPGTSLLMLVDAFMQFKGARRSWRDLYGLAIAERFRFYSFGDAMVIV